MFAKEAFARFGAIAGARTNRSGQNSSGTANGGIASFAGLALSANGLIHQITAKNFTVSKNY